MASREKHMARSHRSHGSSRSAFVSFYQIAAAKKSKKELSKSVMSGGLLERASSMFSAIKDKFHKSQDR